MEETLQSLGFLKSGAMTEFDIDTVAETGIVALTLQLTPREARDGFAYFATTVDGSVHQKLVELRRRYQRNGFFWIKKCVTLREAESAATEVNDKAIKGNLVP